MGCEDVSSEDSIKKKQPKLTKEEQNAIYFARMKDKYNTMDPEAQKLM